jgi:outer membrane lipoprotein-sorting protein
MLFLQTALVSVVVVAAARAASLEEVKKQIVESLGKHKSMQMTSKITQDYRSDDFTLRSTGEVKVEYKRKGEKGFLSRIESKSSDVRKMKDQPEEKKTVSMLNICDGEYMYILTVDGDQKSAMKQKMDPKVNANPFEGTQAFDLLEKDHVLKLLPDETVDGKSCYVLEMTPKEKDKNPQFGRAVHHYEKKTGLALKTVMYAADGKPSLTSVTTDVKLDGDIPAERFVFKAPAGVEVVDMSKMQQQPVAEDKPKEEPKSEPKAEPKAESKEKTADAEKKKEEKPAEPEKKEKKPNPVGGLLKRLR